MLVNYVIMKLYDMERLVEFHWQPLKIVTSIQPSKGSQEKGEGVLWGGVPGGL